MPKQDQLNGSDEAVELHVTPRVVRLLRQSAFHYSTVTKLSLTDQRALVDFARYCEARWPELVETKGQVNGRFS